MSAYYNEIDPYAADWLENLIAAGHIAPGVVDRRSVLDVHPADLNGFVQCHFFAGIGVWSYAARLAGWPDDRPLWTGSCPCQPFSAAGKGGGFADERHLWPAFFHLIEQCRPPVVLGEQVASRDGLAWLDLVCSDLEAAGYACGAVDTCAAGFGAPHIRQRLYWAGTRLALAEHGGREARQPYRHGAGAALPSGSADGVADGDGNGRAPWGEVQPIRVEHDAQYGGATGWVGNPERIRARRHARTGADAQGRFELRPVSDDAGPSGAIGGMADAPGPRRGPEWADGIAGNSAEAVRARAPQSGRCGPVGPPGPTNGFWRDPDWLFCRDDKWRPVRSGSFPLAHGAPARVGRLRAYGNAIVAEQARGFIEAVGASLGLERSRLTALSVLPNDAEWSVLD